MRKKIIIFILIYFSLLTKQSLAYGEVNDASVSISDENLNEESENKNLNNKENLILNSQKIKKIKKDIDLAKNLKKEDIVSSFLLRSGFDSSKKMNKFKFLNEKVFYCNILPNATTTHDVKFSWGDDIGLYVYKDDKIIEYESEAILDEHGYYRVIILSGSQSVSVPNQSFYTIFNFRIVKNRVNDLLIFNAPPDCEILNSIKIEDEVEKELFVNNNNYFIISEDGVYKFIVKDKKTGAIYSDIFVVDNTPPHVKIDGVDAQNVGNGCVSVENGEDDVSLTIIRNGNKIYDEKGRFSQTFTDTGKYRINAVDEAGNTSDYYFLINYRVYVSGQQLIFLIIFVSFCISALVIYLKRKTEIR